MPLELITIPCLSDNYAFLAHDPETGTTALFDIPEAGPILAALADKGWSLDQIYITHHHWDHVGGLNEVLSVHKAQVIGAKADYGRLPPLDSMVSEGDTVSIGSVKGTVMDVSGHTINHVAYYFPDGGVVFTADSLMALGCGRVFEGTKPQMWESMQKFLSLPPETIVASGHEYTEANGRFALTVDPENSALISRMEGIARARAEGKPTVPSTMAEELATNPYLRPDDPGIQAHLGMSGASAVDVFTEIRTRKDNF